MATNNIPFPSWDVEDDTTEARPIANNIPFPSWDVTSRPVKHKP